jgi:nitrate reductase cytochrome c-type subunit
MKICESCIHNAVCDRDMGERCSNYSMGSTKYSPMLCHSCSNYQKTKDVKTCFKCEDYNEKNS